MMGLRPETLLAQATGGVIPPLQPSTTFLRDPDHAYRCGFDHARDRNPTYAPAEAVLAALEGGAEALLFSSGMAAATAVFQALRPGDHVVAPRVIYLASRDRGQARAVCLSRGLLPSPAAPLGARLPHARAAGSVTWCPLKRGRIREILGEFERGWARWAEHPHLSAVLNAVATVPPCTSAACPR
jgi:hypothetical protein